MRGPNILCPRIPKLAKRGVKNTAEGSVRGEMGPNIFCSRIPPSVYYCIHRLPFRLYHRLSNVLDVVGGSRDKNIFNAAGVQSPCVPQAPFFLRLYKGE